eukprot:3316640-Amphidinium_carterae.1
MEAPAAMVTAQEQELNDRATMKDEPSPERGTPGPKREAPRREPIGPKRMAPPRDPDDIQPKRPAHAPVNRPEPDAEPAYRAAGRGTRRPVPPPGGNPMRPPMPQQTQRNLDLLQQCYDAVQDGGALAHNFCFVCYYLVDWLTEIGQNFNHMQTPHLAVLGSALISSDTRLVDRFGCKYCTDSMRAGKGYKGRGNR